METIKVTHNGVDIVWDGYIPAWVFTVRGREYNLLKLEDCKARLTPFKLAE